MLEWICRVEQLLFAHSLCKRLISKRKNLVEDFLFMWADSNRAARRGTLGLAIHLQETRVDVVDVVIDR